MSKIALVMIVKNEEAVLGRCLDSVVGAVDEIVVVDTGSTDGTVALAQSYDDKVPGGVKVLPFEWSNDFSAARNYGLENADSDWALVLDADEELVSPVAEVQLAAGDPEVWAYALKVVVAPDRDSAKSGRFDDSFLATRMFRMGKGLKYKNRIHEGIEVEQKDRKKVSRLTINHFGPALGGRGGRSQRNLEMLKLAIEAEPENMYYVSKMGDQAYTDGDHAGALEWYERVWREGELRLSYVSAAARNSAYCLHQVGHSDEALGVLDVLAKTHPRFTDVFYLKGLVSFWTGDHRTGFALIEKSLKMGDPPLEYFSWGGTGSFRAKAVMDWAIGQGWRRG